MPSLVCSQTVFSGELPPVAGIGEDGILISQDIQSDSWDHAVTTGRCEWKLQAVLHQVALAPPEAEAEAEAWLILRLRLRLRGGLFELRGPMAD